MSARRAPPAGPAGPAGVGGRRAGPRRRARWAWALAAAVLGGALSCIEPRAFPCSNGDECVLAGVQGRCEAEGWCSYPDEGCDGGSRFEALAPAGLGGQCVGVAAGSSTGPDGATTEAESTGPGPTYTCDERPCTTTGLVVGDTHGCVRDGLDALWCWGGNELGQLGRGVTSPAERCPGPTLALGAVVQAAASQHMCALDDAGRVFCWGNNASGQVDGQPRAEAIVRTPVEVDLQAIEPGLQPEALDVGPALTCVASGARVWCWGVVGMPTRLDTTAGVVELAAGAQHACAVIAGGGVECVGLDTKGQLGDGNPAPPGTQGLEESRPLESGATLVDAGDWHTCAVVTTMLGPEVQCWGGNEAGQCGAPVDDAVVEAPTRVPNLVEGPYQALALGTHHSCLLAADGRVQCWGENAEGQVGPAAPAGFGAHTVVLEGDEPLRAIEIGAGRAHTCARTADERVVCWGSNGALQLGAASSEATRTHHWLELGCE